MSETQQLLAEYAANGSETAFRELVARYLDLVYSVALRLLDGDSHLAEDVAQTVFLDLARAAGKLPVSVMLGGWLHRHTCYVASKTLRGERRRQLRERQAVEMNALESNAQSDLSQVRPILDEAINELGSRDRDAILLRFFEQRDFRSVGAALGSTEDAARVRVNRALERLHCLLKARGVALSGAALGVALSSEAITAAPSGLVVSISAGALTGAAAAAGTTVTLLEIMTMTKLKFAILGALVAAGVATPVVLQREAKQRELNASLRQEVDQLAALNEQLSNQTQVVQTPPPTSDQLNDLLRLRNEVSVLRQQTNAVAQLQAENRRLQAGAAQARQPAPRAASPEAQVEFPKESWVFAGYTNPQASFQSAVWSRGTGDLKSYLAGLSPDELKREQGRIARRMQAEGKTEAEVAEAIVAEDFSKVKGFKILNTQAVSNDLTILHIYVDGINEEQLAKLKLIGSEWKFDGWARN